MNHRSLWFDTDEPPAAYPALEGDRRVDVAVLGARITGMTARLLLARVVATLMTFLDRGGFFARAHARRSYIVTARIAGAPPDGMFISAGSLMGVSTNR